MRRDFRGEETLWAKDLPAAPANLTPLRARARQIEPDGDLLDELHRLLATTRILIEQARTLRALASATRATARAIRQKPD